MNDNILEIIDREYLKNLGLQGINLGDIYRFLKYNNIEPTIEELKKLKREDIKKIRGFGKEKQNKAMWLIDYLNGNVDGKYEKEKANTSQEIIELEQRIEIKNIKIEKLNVKIKELQYENRELKETVKALSKKEKMYEKLREFFMINE